MLVDKTVRLPIGSAKTAVPPSSAMPRSARRALDGGSCVRPCLRDAATVVFELCDLVVANLDTALHDVVRLLCVDLHHRTAQRSLVKVEG